MNILQAACYFSSESIVKYLRDVFNKDSPKMQALVEFEEPFGRNQALHFAVLKGNYRIVDILINDLKANPASLTGNGLSILHCASQFERGTLSLELFLDEKYGLKVDTQDSFDCTPLHFAVQVM